MFYLCIFQKLMLIRNTLRSRPWRFYAERLVVHQGSIILIHCFRTYCRLWKFSKILTSKSSENLYKKTNSGHWRQNFRILSEFLPKISQIFFVWINDPNSDIIWVTIFTRGLIAQNFGYLSLLYTVSIIIMLFILTQTSIFSS